MVENNVIKHVTSGMKNVPYHFAHCSEMSLKARGLYVSLFMLPNDWQLNIEGLQAILPDGRNSICSGIKELVRLGFLKRERMIDTLGRIVGYYYHLYSQPLPESDPPKKEEPSADNPQTEEQQLLCNRGNNSVIAITHPHSEGSKNLEELLVFTKEKCPTCYSRFNFFTEEQVKLICSRHNKSDIARILTDIELKACNYNHGSSLFKLFEKFCLCDFKLRRKH